MLIKESNKDKIEKMIKEAEGKAKERRINYDVVNHCIRQIEWRLGIPKKYMEGIEVSVDYWAQDFAKAYKYTPKSTHFKVVKKKTGWDLQWVDRLITRRSGHTYELELTDNAKQKIIERFMNF